MLNVVMLSVIMLNVAAPRIGWKSWAGTNTITYYKHSLITAVKSVITCGPSCHQVKGDFGLPTTLYNFQSLRFHRDRRVGATFSQLLCF